MAHAVGPMREAGPHIRTNEEYQKIRNSLNADIARLTAFMQGVELPPPPFVEGAWPVLRRQHRVGSVLGPPFRREDQSDEEFKADEMAHNNLLILRDFDPRIFATRGVDLGERSKAEKKNCEYIIGLLQERYRIANINEKIAIEELAKAVSRRMKVLADFLHEVERRERHWHDRDEDDDGPAPMPQPVQG